MCFLGARSEGEKLSKCYFPPASSATYFCYDSGIVKCCFFLFGSLNASVGYYVFLFRERLFDLVWGIILRCHHNRYHGGVRQSILGVKLEDVN